MCIAICALGVRFFQRIPHCCDHSCPLCGSSGSRTCLEFMSAQELINMPLVCTWCIGRNCLQLCPVPELLQMLEKKTHWARWWVCTGKMSPHHSCCLWTPTDYWGKEFGLGLGSASHEGSFRLTCNAMMPGSVTEGGHDSPWGTTVNCLPLFFFLWGSHK